MENLRRTRLFEQDPDWVRFELRNDAEEGILLASLSKIDETRETMRSIWAPRSNGVRGTQGKGSAITRIDYEGDLGGGTPQNPLRIGRPKAR